MTPSLRQQESFGPSWRWLVAGLTALLFTAVGGVMASGFSDLKENSARIAACELSIAGMQKDLNYIQQGVDDIKTLLKNRGKP